MSKVIKLQAWDQQEKKMYACAGFLGGQVILFGEDGKVLGKKDDNFILREFTGQMDENEREIYDGDLLEAKEYWGEGDYAEVAWNDEQLQWYLKRNGHFYEPLRTPFANGHFAFTIIGNIHENSNLIPTNN